MGNCLTLPSDSTDLSKKIKVLPIDTMFKLPSPLPTWPQGEGFASGSINLGGLEVCQISTFTKVWATHEGGPDDLGATFFEPSSIPTGFFMLGCYSQPNNKPLFGWVLAGKDDGNGPSGGVLKMPVDYTLVWSSELMKIKQDGNGYIWLPTPPDGYRAVGHVVTSSPEKPPLGKIRCVHSELTDQYEIDKWIWGADKISITTGFDVYSMRPTTRGTQALGICIGTFIAQVGGVSSPLLLACLRNGNSNSSSMPNVSQIEAIVQTYSPRIYFHPDEKYLPSSVSWFFNNGALLYKKGNELEPVSIDPTGSNLPLGGSNDGNYWLDLPVDEGGKERVKKGDLPSSGAYVHVKPVLGTTFTDIAMWVFYPFNGPSRAKVGFINVPLGKIGEHVGDWEHVTLRVSNFTGELWAVYFSEHSSGRWVNASELEFEGGNKVVSYASLHGHAFYSKPGLVLQGNTEVGIRNDAAKSKMVMDTGVRFVVVSAEYLGTVVEPLWLNYARKWGPKISYDRMAEIKVEKLLPSKLKSTFEHFVNSLPNEVLGEEGPTGPKMKNNWNGDEV
ncbi:hypothetical protein HHK36_017611 [Tetracentron sinense]|uniref:Vacuolar protein sorting-associated protein 62 n=1 Tax=Tetracentron sinense TaxID=13715 RepID=A0A834YYH3_TETSI|nr:hypothetical protein HHK36_017611 [Tetracentron sinense]